jgi:hypothetical protein
MIGHALRVEIELWASRIGESPFFRLAREGRLSRGAVVRYVANITYLVSLSPGFLQRAQDRAAELGDPKLALHFAQKRAEEAGHDAWGRADLRELGADGFDVSRTAAVAEMASFLARNIEEAPARYLAYIAFAEYVTVLVGPELLELLEQKNGVPRSSVSIVGKHIEHDIHHSEEGWEAIDDLVVEPTAIAEMRTTLRQVMGFFDAFSEELAATSNPLESSPRLIGIGDASAA